MRKDIDLRRKEITNWLESGVPRAEIARRLKCKYDTLRLRIDRWGLSHLKNQAGEGRPRLNSRIHVSKHLKYGSLVPSDRLKKWLWRDEYKEKKCELCGITHWQGREAPLELDHIDGDKWNNKLENLRILCANCHGQTSTNSGKNIRRKKKNYCLNCSNLITKQAKRCKSCVAKLKGTKILWPPVKELIRLVQASSYSETGRLLSVSDNTVRKHIEKYK